MAKVDARNYEHIALTSHGDKMFTCILTFHMSNDGLKVLTLNLLMDQLEQVTVTVCQMGCDGCKKKL